MTVLRNDLLAGRVIGAGAYAGASELRDLLVGLGASLQPVSAPALDAVVYDARLAFGEGGDGGLQAALEDAWKTVAAAATGSLIPSGRGGKVVLIAPRAGAGPRAEAARSGLENLARTLSIEWARYGLTVTAIAPGERTAEADLATLVAFVLCEAGDYFSGARFDLGSTGLRSR